MEVILTNDVVGVGDIGQKVSVRPGYARNFLIPNGLAIETSSKSASIIAHKMKQIEAKKKELKGSAQTVADSLRNVKIELGLKVGGSGKVFGSISSRDVAEKLKEVGYDIDRRRIQLHEPIKKVGEHKVKVKLHAEIESQINLNVVAVAASKEDEDRAAEALKKQIEEKTQAPEDKAGEELE